LELLFLREEVGAVDKEADALRAADSRGEKKIAQEDSGGH
jgi:hypothetical protein